MQFDGTMSVDAIMRRWPDTIRFFHDHGLSCSRCPLAGLHSLDDVCRIYRLDAHASARTLSLMVGGVTPSVGARASRPPAP